MEKNEKTPKTVERENVGSEVTAKALEIVDMATKGVAQGTDLKDSGDSGAVKPLKNDVVDSFKGLPMRDLIANPLLAAAEAQEKLAAISWDYFQKIAYESDKSGNPDQTKTRLLQFTLERPVEQNGQMMPFTQTVKAPFIGLVPIPALLIDRVDVDFQMEVTATNTETSSSASEASTNISAKWFSVSAQVSGKVSSSRENTRSTNQTAKYQVHVSASQQPQTEGLSKLMDIMASCIEPIPVSS